MESMKIERLVNQCWRMLKQYYAINAHQKMTCYTVQFFCITLHSLISYKGDMILHIKQPRDHISSIKNN